MILADSWRGLGASSWSALLYQLLEGRPNRLTESIPPLVQERFAKPPIFRVLSDGKEFSEI